jgi:hypothetical protein
MARRPTHGFRTALAASAAMLLALLILPACSERDDEREAQATMPIPAAVQVPSGNSLKLRYHAVGMQVYTWNATLGHWGAPQPLATLFLGEVLSATHSEGPVWQHTDGSKVVGAKIGSAEVGATAIPWLLIKAASVSGPGLFADVTYVQRLNTRGGVAPIGPGSSDGAQVQVHYEADYLFYHSP